MAVKLTPEQQLRADELSRMTSDQWDAVCKRCGVCCLEKIEIHNSDVAALLGKDNATLYLKRCCDKFDMRTCRCSVYNTRLAQPDCEKVNMDTILDGKSLPASCGYVEYIFGPAPFPAQVEFRQVRPIAPDGVEKMSATKIGQEAILESVFWNVRQR